MPPMPTWLPKLVRLTRLEYFADLAMSVPIAAALIAVSAAHGVGWHWAFLVAFGWLAWTLYEYAVHRASHHVPWLRELHWLHHADQRAYIGLHPAVTVVFYAATWLTFGFAATPVAIGFSLGHVVYLALHAAIHYATIRKGNPLWSAKVRHLKHHRFHDSQFGVTTGFWDRVFRTDGRSGGREG